MTGIGLLDFLIFLIVLAGVVWIFFLVIGKVSPDPLFTQIAQVAVGIGALVAFVIAIAGVLGFGGGLHVNISAMSLITFAAAVIVGLLVLYIVNLFLDWLATVAPAIAPFIAAIKYIIGGVVLIALMIVAGNALFGGGGLPSIGPRGFRSGAIPGRSFAAYTTAASVYLQGMLSG